MTIAGSLESMEHGTLGMGPEDHPNFGSPTNPTELFPLAPCSRVRSMSLCFGSCRETESEHSSPLSR